MSRPSASPRRPVIAVVGPGECAADETEAAYRIGRLIAERGGIVVTGGMTGVMEAASRGARDGGGLALGILPGPDAGTANEFVSIAVPTGMGQLRNGLVVNSGSVVIAVGGEWGTLSEISLARKQGKPVIGWHTWDLGLQGEGLVPVATAEEAVDTAFAQMEAG